MTIGDCGVVAIQQVQSALPGRRVEVLPPDLALLHADARVQAAHHAVRLRIDLPCDPCVTPPENDATQQLFRVRSLDSCLPFEGSSILASAFLNAVLAAICPM